MKKIGLLISVIVCIWAILSCESESPKRPSPTPPRDNVNIVSQFVYDGLSIYYKWADEMKDKTPTTRDNDPQVYFESLLSQPDTEHGWSWLTDDVDGLLDGFSGKSVGFGYSLFFTMIDNQAYAVVKYVFPNTPASNQGVERLHLIGKVNGSPIGTYEEGGKTYIAQKDVQALFGENQATFTLYKFADDKLQKDKDVTITPTEIQTNPVLFHKVYTLGSKKVGYLFYTGFIYNYNYKLYEAFENFKAEGITDLVVDLRYNRGGSIGSASYLASMIAPVTAVQNHEVLTTLSYNNEINALFDKRGWNRETKLGEYSKKEEQNPLNVNSNLQKVYIIVTQDSYSASELTTFCLKPYMEVVQIGNKTGGKYTASWTITPLERERTVGVYDANKLPAKHKNQLKNWAMQPIVAIYTDKNGQTFMDTDGLIPSEENMLREGFGKLSNWKPLGDPKDTFLGQAFYLITGDSQYKPVKAVATKSSTDFYYQDVVQAETFDEQILKKAVIIDMPKDLRELIAK